MSIQIAETGLKAGAIDRSAYLGALLAQCSTDATNRSSKSGFQDWLKEVRDRASALVQEQTIPSTRDEEWRFTDLSPLLQFNFQPAARVSVDAEAVAALTLPEATNSRLVFVNGVYAPELSNVVGLPPGVFVGSLAHLSPADSDRVRYYLANQPGAEEVFTALNTSGLTDVVVVWVAKNIAIEKPIHLLFISVAAELPALAQPRCLVVAEAGSRLTLLEHYTTASAACPDATPSRPYFTNTVTEIWVGENAEIIHSRIQREGGEAFHIGKSAIAQARNSRYTCNAVSLGAKLSRHNLEIFQTGEATETTLNGLTMITGEQQADTHSAIALNHPLGKTRQLHKCIVSDRAHAVFNGKVFVPKPAQLTDAGQLSRTLLLSPKARVDTKPQLEITADNVKCSHGATVSQLDAEEIFYLQSRGLDADDARTLLIDAFAAEIIHQLPVDSLQKMLSRCVACRTID